MKTRLRILHLEDDPQDAELIRETLEAAGLAPEIVVVRTRGEYLSQLDQDWEIILADYNLPQFNGLQALELFQERGLDISFIIISGTVGEDTAVAAMKAGAHDYLMKDHLARLAPAIERELHEAGVRRERRRLDKSLQEAARQWQTTFDAIRDPIYLVDTDDRIQRCNQACRDLVGKTSREIVGRLGHEIVTSTAGPSEEWPFVRMKHSRQRETMSLAMNERYFDLVVDPVSAESGNLLGAVYVLIDITQRQRAEAEREKLHGQLSQAQKMESVGRLAGGVAHDFNNMLGVILGHTELALEHVDPALPVFAHLQEIREAAQRSANLTRQLLTFARKQTIAPRVIDLNETVEGMLKMLRRLIGEDIDLAWLPGKNLRPVKVDPSQIDQLLANLCVNARDAIAGVGKVTIETGAVAFDEADCAAHAGLVPGEYVLLAVSDNGCGMEAATLGHLFEPFFTTKELGKGTGLGLATVYGAVQQNNGCIHVYSEPGRGTTFKIYLPRHAARTAALSPEQAAGRPAECGHETILLVEDEPAILKMTTLMLERQGYTVVPAASPGEAIRLAHEHAGQIDLLITDVVMPEMNGRDLARNLLSLYPDLKRLFMSGYTANVIAHHGVLDEGVHFIQKPFSRQDLAAKVREALGTAQRE